MPLSPSARIDAPAPGAFLANDQTDADPWASAVVSDAFSQLLATKVRCVAPLLGLSFAFIVAMTLMAGYAKDFMALKLFGSFNVGYLLVLLTYGVCWVVSLSYVLTANRKFDAQAATSIEALKHRNT